ncbi:hypothetical protein NQ315_014870 [Exocentrus adspersus]|uniref:Reverse transcriptase domain-containing protein n=1 Tax=Exocentrus adspersus TaxID=1586481 RepID=A0AAV8VLN7_9CUCU|nr:hypothetical protein NQ315_014870 [Exocentrus adspersus]
MEKEANDYGPYIVYIEANEDLKQNLGHLNHLSLAREIFDLNLSDVKKFDKKDIRRLNRRVVNENGEVAYVPTGTVQFTISGKVLPRFVEICFLSMPIEPFKQPVVQCYNCYRYGHTRNQCREQSSKEFIQFGARYGYGNTQPQKKKNNTNNNTGYNKEAHSQCLYTPMARQKTPDPTLPSRQFISRPPNDTTVNRESSPESSLSQYIADLLNNMTEEQTNKVMQFIVHITSSGSVEYKDRDSPTWSILVTGDLNAHNPLWGSELKNYNGDTIESCLEILDLVILNDGSPTRLTPPGTRPSAVDLTLASPQIAIKLSWHVIPDCGSSDHFPILTTSGDRERHGDIVQMTAKRNYKRADWNSFYTFLETVVDQYTGGKNINFPNTEVAREILDNLTPVVVQPEFQITANEYEIEKFNMVEFENSIAGKKDKATGLDEPERDPNIPSSYRPIALASCVGKLWENLIKTRVEWTVEQNNLIPEKQYGFRRGKSVTDNLCYITSFVQLGFSRNMYTLGVFLDIKGAYDNVDIYVLYKKLESTGIPTYLINSIFQTVCNRAIYVRDKTGGLVGPKLANLGLAQGSPLSPLLFNIYIGDMQKDMLPNIETLFLCG